MISKFLKKMTVLALAVMILVGTGAKASILDEYDYYQKVAKKESKAYIKQAAKKRSSGGHFTELKKAVIKYKRPALRTVSGLPTSDIANIAVGLFTVEAVLSVFHHNEVVRDMDTRACGIMGSSEVSDGSDSTGKYCCEKLWETEGKKLLSSGKIEKKMGGTLGGWDEYKRARLKNRKDFMEYCCQLSDDKKRGDDKVFCKTSGDEKTGCVMGELSKGDVEMSEALGACNIECDPKYYGTLKHNKDGEYEEDEIDQLIKTCLDAETTWAPSTTVPGAKEFVPTVPDDVKKALVKGLVKE